MDRVRESWWSRLGAIVGFGFLLRLAFVLGETRFDEPVGDQLYYSAQALTNAQGRWFEQPFAQGMPAADHPPLTSLILTPVSWITEASGSFITAQRLTMVVIGTTSMVLMALIGRLLANERVGLIAAGITALYANVWVNDGLVMAETPTFFLVASTVLVAAHWRRRPNNRLIMALGVLGGLLALTRPELVLVVPLLALFVALVLRSEGSKPKAWAGGSAMLMAISLLVLAPWIAWNQSRFTDSVFVSTNDGLTLAGANCDSTYGDDIGSWDIWCAYETVVPSGSDASRASTLMRADGLSYWREHLGQYPKVALARVARVLSFGFIGSNNQAATSEGRPEWVSMLGVIQFWLIAAAAMVGWRRLAGRFDRWLLIVLLPTTILVAMVANAYVRFRLPAEVGLIVLAAVGMNQLLRRRRSVSCESA